MIENKFEEVRVWREGGRERERERERERSKRERERGKKERGEEIYSR